MSVPRSSQDGQEARPVADLMSKCFNGGAGEQHCKLDKLSVKSNQLMTVRLSASCERMRWTAREIAATGQEPPPGIEDWLAGCRAVCVTCQVSGLKMLHEDARLRAYGAASSDR